MLRNGIVTFLLLCMIIVWGCTAPTYSKVDRQKEVPVDASTVAKAEAPPPGAAAAEKAPAPPMARDAGRMKSPEMEGAPRTSMREPVKGKMIGGTRTGLRKAPPGVAPLPSVPAASGLKAGFSDDNKQFNYFLSFLKKYGVQVPHYPLAIDERILIRVRDKNNRSVANALVQVYSDKTLLCAGRTYADGTFLFFPSEYDSNIFRYRAVISSQQERKELIVDRQGTREIVASLKGSRYVPQNIPLDLLFILDTTGSMSEEINRLKNTIEIINLNLTSLSLKPDVRFGMVLYKDRGDEYVTHVVPLTNDLEQFRTELNKVFASGGGDGPEDLQSALHDSLKDIKWNQNGIRLAYIITDAPPHLDYGQKYTYVNAVHDARAAGIKIYSVGTGGLDTMGEYILRQIAQYTYAKYIFLTYGEKGESEGGREGSVSHHTGANFKTDKLESIIIHFAKEELGFLTDQPIAADDAYFKAVKLPDEAREETLRKLFDMSIAQLIDYSSINIEKGTPVSVIHFTTEKAALKSSAEYFSEQMNFSLSRNKAFRVVERKDMQKIIAELKLQSAGIIDDATAAKAGKLMGARMIFTGRVYEVGETYEIFMKMLRVETGEVLSVNKLKIDSKLGLAK